MGQRIVGMPKGKRSYTPHTTADGATEHIVKGSAAPTENEKQEIAQRLLHTEHAESIFETRDGACRVKRLTGVIGQFCCPFGECDEASCSLTRSRTAEPRKLFRHAVVEGELERVASARKNGTMPVAVRAVSIGCGGLLTDFECLLELWSRGCTIETFVAIDTCYAEHSSGHRAYLESVAALARFFAPDCRVFSFSSCSDYVAAAISHPECYGRATLFMRCDARSLDEAQYRDTAATALLPGCCAYELRNGGNEVRPRPPLEKDLPQRLRTDLASVYDRTWYYSLGVLRRRRGTLAEAQGATADGAAAGSAETLPAGFGASLLEEVQDASILASREHVLGKRLMAEAAHWLASTARRRAAEHGKRLFTVVHDGPLPVRDNPFPDAEIVGTRARGDEVIVDQMLPNGWVCISRLLDTREGYELYHPEHEHEAWMPTRAEEGGELMCEIPADEGVK